MAQVSAGKETPGAAGSALAGVLGLAQGGAGCGMPEKGLPGKCHLVA